MAIVIPLLSLHGLTIYTAAQQAREQASLSALGLAQLAATDIQQFLQETEVLLAQVTQRPLIRAVDPSRCDPFLADFYATQPQFATMFVADAAGQIICSATPPMTESGSLPAVADRPWFQSISHTHAFTVGSAQLGRLHGRWDSVLAYPILNEADQLVGVLGAPIDLTRYQISLTRVTLPAGTVIILLDADGVVIARSLDPEKWIGRNARDAEIVTTVLAQPEGQAQVRGVDGVERIYGFTTVTGAGWHVYAGIPTAVAFAPVREAILRDSLLSLMVVVLVVLLARWVSRQIERPIGSLAQASQAAAVGLETHVPVEGPREIAAVAEQFNHMLAAQAATTAALKLSEERFRHTFEQAAVGIAHITPTGRFLRFNRRFVDIIGYAPTEILRRTFQDITYPDDLEIDVTQFQQLLAEEIQTYTIEKRYIRQDDSLVWVNLTVSLVRQPDGGPDYLIKVVEDITQRKQAEEALRESEERYRNLLDVAPVGIAVYSEGKIVFTNPAGARLLGAASEEQIVGRPVVDIIHPDGLKAAHRRIQRMLAGEQGLYPVEDTYLKLDGTPIPVEVMATALPYQGKPAVQVIVTDISVRKQAEAALRLARERLETLSHQLLAAQEMERRRLARELHDEIGQSLSMVKIDLHMVQQLLQQTDLVVPLHESVEMVERALQQVRALSVELRPSLLDDLGLIPALRWYVDRQSRRGKFTAYFAADPLPGRLAPELETVCFRLVQEALTNVLRYAQAGRVEVELKVDEATLHLAIRDDGVGFNAAEALVGAVQGGSLGLLGMQERAALVGGWLEITSAPGYGAEIQANLPLKYAAPAEGEA